MESKQNENISNQSNLLNDVQYYNWEEISRHNQKNDCWIVIDNSVYNVTEWVDQHPGGKIISALAGEDVSALFHSSHMRMHQVIPVLGKYKIGQIRENAPESSINDEFMIILKQRVLNYFTENNIDYRETKILKLQIFYNIFGFLVCWYFAYYQGVWIAVVPMGLISCAMIGSFAHEYIHSTLNKSDNQDIFRSTLCSLIWPIIFPFMPEKYFQYEHFSHHIEPLNAERDYEVYALRKVIRLSSKIPHRWFFKYQKFYAPLAYAFYITIQVIEGYISPYFDSRQIRQDPAYAFSIYTAPIISLSFHIAFPVMHSGWKYWLLCFILYNATWQFTTYLVAAVVHMTSLEESHTANWSYNVCHNTCNVLCGNPFYDWLSGGFNYQIDHHLLPFISRETLPKINHIVQQTCQNYGYPYNEYRNFLLYCQAHYSYLECLGKN